MSRFNRSGISLACIALLTLYACGGSGNGDGNGNGSGQGGAGGGASNPPPGVAVKVIDGALRNAQVFLDKNRNGALDEGEPTARSDEGGIARLDIASADLGTAPVVALVGTDASDADSGAVTAPYAMSAPADSIGVVSPLTTLVQRIVEDTGVSTADAEAAAKSRTGIASLLADYTADTSASGREAALAARMMVLATQQQSANLAAAAGTPDMGGTAITAGDIDRAILGSMARSLPELAAAARGQQVQAACGGGLGAQSCQSLLAAQAAQVNAAGSLSSSSLPLLVAAWRTPNPGGTTPQASATLSEFAFGDVDNWYYRVFVATAQENTPDGQGMTHVRGIRRANANGSLFEWGNGGSYARREDAHWNGSAWVACPAVGNLVQSVRDANGRTATADFCDALETSASGQWALDISGRGMAEVNDAMRQALPGSAGWAQAPANYTGGGSANWGQAVFPSGSRLTAQSSVVTTTAFSYDVTSPVLAYSAAVAAGGDARNDPASACRSPEAQAAGAVQMPTLEELAGRYKGTPCIFGPGVINSTASPTPLTGPDPDAWWSNSTLSIGVVGQAPLLANPTSYFTGNDVIRVGFNADGTGVNYYSCLQRQVNGSSRNCVPIGTGQYAITTLGDARVLSLSNAPAQAALLDYERVFVERGGKVYFGYQSKKVVRAAHRLNLTATNAMFGQLGIPTVTP